MYTHSSIALSGSCWDTTLLTADHIRQWAPTKEEATRVINNIARVLRETMIEDVGKCAHKGLRDIVFVIGNDEDKKEFNLIPLDQGFLHGSYRERKALSEIDTFSQELEVYWKEKELQHRMPNIKAMTVQRKPLETFSLFSRLPMELQLLIVSTLRHPHVQHPLSSELQVWVQKPRTNCPGRPDDLRLAKRSSHCL